MSAGKLSIEGYECKAITTFTKVNPETIIFSVKCASCKLADSSPIPLSINDVIKRIADEKLKKCKKLKHDGEK